MAANDEAGRKAGSEDDLQPLNLKRALEAVYSRLRYYPEGHPSRAESLEQALEQMDPFFKRDPELTLSVAGGHFLINGEEVEDPHRGVSTHFEKAMTRARTSDITVRRGVTASELEAFFGILQQAMDGSTSVEEELEKGKTPHFRVEMVRWERVREGDVVISEDEKDLAESTGEARLNVAETVDQPTKADRAIIDILVSEYDSGGVEPVALARLAMRLLPDAAALKRCLPLLKERLTAAGMRRLAYLEFVRELNREFKHEELLKDLEKAADASGATVDELMDELRSSPEHVGKLMLLAADLEARGETETLVKTLADTVDRLASRLMQEGSDAKVARRSARMLRSVEKAVADELKSSDVAPEKIAEFQEATRKIVDQLPLRAMVGEVVQAVHDGERDPGKVAQRIVKSFGSRDRVEAVRDTLMRRLEAEGLSAADVESVAAEVERRFDEKAFQADRRRLEKAVRDGESDVLLNRAAAEWLAERVIAICRRGGIGLAAGVGELLLETTEGSRFCREDPLLDWVADLLRAAAGPEALLARFDRCRLIILLPGATGAEFEGIWKEICRELGGYQIELEDEVARVRCRVRTRCWEPKELAGRTARILFRELLERPVESPS